MTRGHNKNVVISYYCVYTYEGTGYYRYTMKIDKINFCKIVLKAAR